MKTKYLFIVVMILSSCNKYDLEGEKAIFVGTWKWVFTVGNYSDGGGGGWESELLAQNYKDVYSMEFNDNGRIFLKKNDETIDKGKARFLTWDSELSPGKYLFDINFDGEYTMTGLIWSDTIMLMDDVPSYFPPFNESNAWRYESYFVKQ